MQIFYFLIKRCYLISDYSHLTIASNNHSYSKMRLNHSSQNIVQFLICIAIDTDFLFLNKADKSQLKVVYLLSTLTVLLTTKLLILDDDLDLRKYNMILKFPCLSPRRVEDMPWHVSINSKNHPILTGWSRFVVCQDRVYPNLTCRLRYIYA